jgi:hypothetical protein
MSTAARTIFIVGARYVPPWTRDARRRSCKVLSDSEIGCQQRSQREQGSISNAEGWLPLHSNTLQPLLFSPETRRRVFVVNPFPCGPGSSQFVTRHTWASYVVRALSPSHQRDKVQDSGGEGAVKGLGRSEMKFEVEVKLGAGGMGNPGREDGSWGCLFFCSCTGLSVLCGLFCSCS